MIRKWGSGVIYSLCVAINFGLRIGGLLRIRVQDILDIDDMIRDTFAIVEQKTRKRNFVFGQARCSDLVGGNPT